MIEELLDYAEHEFSISKPDKSGISKREHLEQVERQTGKTPEELIGPQFPMSVSYIWSAFLALNSARTVGFSGPNPLTYTEIQAWLTLTNQHLSSRDIEAIKKLDIVYLGIQHG